MKIIKNISLKSVGYDISLSATSSNIYAYIYELEEENAKLIDSICLIQGDSGENLIGLLNTNDATYLYVEQEFEYNGDNICNCKLISYGDKKITLEMNMYPMTMEYGYCIVINTIRLNEQGRNVEGNTLWWFGDNGKLEYNGTDERFINKTPTEAMFLIMEWYGLFSMNSEQKFSVSEYYEKLCLSQHQLTYYSSDTEQYIGNVIDYSGVERTQSTFQDFYFDEAAMLEKSVKRLKEIYNRGKEGTIVIFEDEIVYMGGDEYFLTIRYQMPDKEINEIVESGGFPATNVWYADVCLRLSNGDFSDNEWISQYNIWSE